MIALHEPIRPGTISNSNSKVAIDNLKARFRDFEVSIATGQPFEHGDKGGLSIENPVGHVIKNGVRQVVAARGEVILPKRKPGEYKLIIKQNAMFTSLLSELAKEFPVICIVRNPVDVLMSWLTVDLPVNKGRLPGGERFDNKFKQHLDVCENRLSRQLAIYQWFIRRFLVSGCNILRYEDLISTSGAELDRVLNLDFIQREKLQKQERCFTDAVINKIREAKQGLLSLDCGSLYRSEDIKRALTLHGL